MISEPRSCSTSQMVDSLMRDLYRRSRNTLHQTLVADYSIADAYRNVLDPTYPISRRPVVRAAQMSWRVLKGLLGYRYAVWVGGLLWTMVGAPDLLGRATRLHSGSYIRQGDPSARRLLLRTGVANEPLIARWIEEQEKEAVAMLQRNDSAEVKLQGMTSLPRLATVYARVCFSAIREIARYVTDATLSPPHVDALLPAWFVLLGRRASGISWNHVWAERNLRHQPPKCIYFTMNYEAENAFRLALPNVATAYVEHGFPRRDMPPLPCRQYVYSKGYADYLRSFDEALNVEVIGLEYFSHGHIQPTRTIVVASLQDWPQFKVDRVSKQFNDALDQARQAGWRLVFRTRQFDSDSFARALQGSWDEVSRADNESFLECLERFRPAMVWTTWSTAVLDAAAQDIASVAFVTPDLNDYFIADLETFAFLVNDEVSYRRLVDSLQKSNEREVRRELEPTGHREPCVPHALAPI